MSKSHKKRGPGGNEVDHGISNTVLINVGRPGISSPILSPTIRTEGFLHLPEHTLNAFKLLAVYLHSVMNTTSAL